MAFSSTLPWSPKSQSKYVKEIGKASTNLEVIGVGPTHKVDIARAEKSFDERLFWWRRLIDFFMVSLTAWNGWRTITAKGKSRKVETKSCGEAEDSTAGSDS